MLVVLPSLTYLFNIFPCVSVETLPIVRTICWLRHTLFLPYLPGVRVFNEAPIPDLSMIISLFHIYTRSLTLREKIIISVGSLIGGSLPSIVTIMSVGSSTDRSLSPIVKIISIGSSKGGSLSPIVPIMIVGSPWILVVHNDNYFSWIPQR